MKHDENVIDATEKFNWARSLNQIRENREKLDEVALYAVKRAREDGVDWGVIGECLGIGGGQAYVQYAHLLKESCGACWMCLSVAGPVNWMILCSECGNKRCPHAADHTLECTRSNEPGQEGSLYA